MKKSIKLIISLVLVVCMFIPTISIAGAATLAQVKGLKASETATTSIKLSWTKVKGAKGYQVYQYNGSSGNWKKLATTSAVSYKVTGLSSAKTYKFKVRAYAGSTYGKYSAELTTLTKPGKVGNLSSSASTESTITLMWNSVTRAKGYQVYYYKDSSWVKVGSTTSTAVKISSLSKGKTYQFKVRAYYTASGVTTYGAYSTVLKTSTSPSQVTNLTLTSTGTGKCTVSWNKVTGATGYQVYISTNGTSWEKVSTTTAANATISTTATKIYVKVRAYVNADRQIYGTYSSTLTVNNNNNAVLITKPANLKIDAPEAGGQANLTWDAVEGADGYQIYVYDTQHGTWNKYDETKESSYTYPVSETTTYYFKVRSFVTVGSETYYSDFSDQNGVSYKSNKTNSNVNIAVLEKQGVLGYLYDAENNCFYTATDPWQRVAGFTPFYDYAAPLTYMWYSTVRIRFNYNNLDWMIQLWKGQYGYAFIGGEIGVYTKDPNFNVEFYQCASDENSLNMSMVIFRNGKQIVTRPYATWWWCTGFTLGTIPGTYLGWTIGDGIDTSCLKMVARITMKDTIMRDKFVKAMVKQGLTNYVISGLDVIFTWQEEQGVPSK